jgi:hypothetical protein
MIGYTAGREGSLANWFVLKMPECDPPIVSARDLCRYIYVCVCTVHLALELKTVFYFKMPHNIHLNSVQ